MRILVGKQFAEDIVERLKEDVSFLSESPGMAAILVGNDEASKIYVGLKEKIATEIGIRFIDYILPQETSQENLLALIDTLNRDSAVQGILIQLPLPKHLDKNTILLAIDPQKDIDGLTPENQRLFLEGEPRFWCPFPRAIMTLLNSTGEDLKGKKAALLVNSVGLAETLDVALAEKGVRSIFIFPKDVQEKRDVIAECDIVISALGMPESITEDFIKQGAVVIDGGIDRIGDEVKGDMHKSVQKKAGYLTPVPGGVGPLTIAHLMENVISAVRRSRK